MTPLHVAAGLGHAPVVQYLVEKGADINKAGRGGVTPLFLASIKGHLPVVKLLVEHGADMEKGEEKGITPILMASQLDQVAVVTESACARSYYSISIRR